MAKSKKKDRLKDKVSNNECVLEDHSTYKNPKRELSFHLDNEQIATRQQILKNKITVLIGKAGSGKTAVACYTALKLLFDGDVEKIIVCRPMISNEQMGFLSGSMKDKFTPWITPMIQNFNKMSNPKMIEYFINKGIIEMLPLQFTRGITYDKACMILDEAQNTTAQQIKMIMSRIGKESKIIITGDCDQIDLRKTSDSGLLKIKDFSFPNFEAIELQNEHRDQIVIDVLNAFKEIGL